MQCWFYMTASIICNIYTHKCCGHINLLIKLCWQNIVVLYLKYSLTTSSYRITQGTIADGHQGRLTLPSGAHVREEAVPSSPVWWMCIKAVPVTVSLRKHRDHLEDFSKPNGDFGQDLSHLQSLCRTATQRDKERNRKGLRDNEWMGRGRGQKGQGGRYAIATKHEVRWWPRPKPGIWEPKAGESGVHKVILDHAVSSAQPRLYENLS